MKITFLKTKTVAVAFAAIAALTVIPACEKEGENETKISAHGETESHNKGQNCMNCHKQGGEGEGWFNAAGTVYNSSFTATYPNATVRLYTGPGGTGTLKHIIEVDAKGNFFTTESIDFSAGLYPSVEGNTATNYMSTPTVSGQCNSCHGVSTNRISAE